MKAVVLAGGTGTRLAPYTRILPKPLLPVGDRPILDIIIGQLRDAGVDEIVVATGYLSGLIETFFGDGLTYGVSISYAREVDPLGTAGPIATIDGLDETFIMMNGDILTTPPYAELLEAHRVSGAVATIATRPEEVEIDYGVVRLGEQVNGIHRIDAYEEKPTFVCQVSAGIYVFEPEVVEYVTPGERLDFPELLGRLLEAGQPVASHQHDGYWMDVGQLHHLEAAVQEFEGSAERFVGGSGGSSVEQYAPLRRNGDH